jgi:hypothetical protein
MFNVPPNPYYEEESGIISERPPWYLTREYPGEE